jgi:hypothetical protein
MSAAMRAVSNVGARSGTVTRRKVVQVPAPAMMDASSYDESIRRCAGSIRITMIGIVLSVMCSQVMPASE